MTRAPSVCASSSIVAVVGVALALRLPNALEVLGVGKVGRGGKALARFCGALAGLVCVLAACPEPKLALSWALSPLSPTLPITVPHSAWAEWAFALGRGSALATSATLAHHAARHSPSELVDGANVHVLGSYSLVWWIDDVMALLAMLGWFALAMRWVRVDCAALVGLLVFFAVLEFAKAVRLVLRTTFQWGRTARQLSRLVITSLQLLKLAAFWTALNTASAHAAATRTATLLVASAVVSVVVDVRGLLEIGQERAKQQ